MSLPFLFQSSKAECSHHYDRIQKIHVNFIVLISVSCGAELPDCTTYIQRLCPAKHSYEQLIRRCERRREYSILRENKEGETAIKPKKMSMKTKKSKRIIAWILICALALSLVPASIVLAEEAYPPYQMTEEKGKVLEHHNTTTPIPLADIPDILGISDISTALTRVVDNGNPVWTSTDLGDMTLEADKTYTVQNGKIKMPSWNPSTWYTEWTDSYKNFSRESPLRELWDERLFQ